MSDGPDRLDIILEAEQDEELDTVISETFSRLARHYDLSNVVAIGHRVVHGGDIFDGPVFVDDKTIIQMQALVPLAPLHQSQAMHLIHAIRRLRPNIPQTASFDTAFHRTNADIVRRFALPRALHDKGIKRYGFHGLSYKFIAGALTREWPMEAAGKVVVAHMGSGVSLCALDSCVSRDTSMGFSTLDGVPMATRCGTLDAGVVLHLARNGESVGQLETLLYHKSGLLGVSGISGDTRVLLDSEKEEAREALELFTLRIAGEIARLANTLGGLDTLVFTGGIGENQPAVRAEICTRLMWLGIDLDPKANEGSQSVITSQASRITVLVIPTDEERVIADRSLHVLRSTPS